ncbi:MAG: hypothetical protein Q9191_007303 [Dirinaria sp. TL-2023a]
MKSYYAVTVSVLFGYAIAGHHNAHEVYHNKVRDLASRGDNATCGCTTYYTTIVGPGTYQANLQVIEVVQDIQPNTTTTHITRTEHVKVTVIPEANSTTSAPSTEITSHPAPLPASPKSYAQSSSSPSPPASAPTSPEVASSASANSPINASPQPAPAPYKAAAKPVAKPVPAPEKAAPKPNTGSHPVEQAPAPKPNAGAPAPEHASAPIASGGSQWCMTYSPYTASGGCKSALAVSSDVAAIAAKGFSSIRLYSTDCSGLENVGSAASSHGLNLVLGVFISETGIGAAAQEQVDEITNWAKTAKWDTVEMIVIGNEALFNGYCTPSSLAEFLSNAKTALQKAGYTGPVTTTEPLNVLQEYAATLCPVMDVASANIHPFFNADVTAASAGHFVATELSLLAALCPGGNKDTYNLETGWPNQGRANGAACPGVEEQREAVESIRRMAGGKSAFFSFEDDLWKAEGEFGVERSWGCASLFEG